MSMDEYPKKEGVKEEKGAKEHSSNKFYNQDTTSSDKTVKRDENIEKKETETERETDEEHKLNDDQKKVGQKEVNNLDKDNVEKEKEEHSLNQEKSEIKREPKKNEEKEVKKKDNEAKEKKEENKIKETSKEQKNHKGLKHLLHKKTNKVHSEQRHHERKNKIRDWYVKNYKASVIITLTIFIILLAGMFIKSSITGELINKDISLKGGITFTIPFNHAQDFNRIEQAFHNAFPKGDINLRILGTSAQSLSIETSDLNETQIISVLSNFNYFKKSIDEKDYTVVTVGSVLGEGFFKETTKAIILSFIFMSIVVLIYFRSFIPSLFVSWNALADVTETFAVLSIFGIKVSTASIAALLMLIGYSVDTNVLLTSRVLKAAYDKIISLIFSSMKTGLAMTATTVITTVLAYFISQSLVIQQIMFILTIGLLFDTLNTWMFNAPLLRWYLENKFKR